MHCWGCGGWLRHGGKGKDMFIKDNVLGDVNTISRYMETLVAFM
jgi:hypothetical protein